ncbi:hypothetical protein [Nesterenkonia sp. F]|uniref:hypothetical protein n=1 Tax=Nesterenkonia sp. F TaxID=795955 RepID=UPI000255CE76|nr:hypothetical protein [Nesterenkonia sp. F]
MDILKRNTAGFVALTAVATTVFAIGLRLILGEESNPLFFFLIVLAFINMCAAGVLANQKRVHGSQSSDLR